jgi:hypothetical protein
VLITVSFLVFIYYGLSEIRSALRL